MGAFFANVQVFTGSMDNGEAVLHIQSAIRSWMKQTGYEEIPENDHSEADRTFLVGEVYNGRWLTVYDQELASQDGTLEELAAFISRESSAPTVGVLVHDSDLMLLRLFEQGKRIDTVVNDLTMYNEMFGKSRKRNGSLNKWKPFLLPGRSEQELRQAWEKRTVFAEENVAAVAETVGWHPEECSSDYQRIEESSLSTLYTSLRFREINKRPPHFEENGPPKLTYTGYRTFIQCSSGQVVTERFGLRNQGRRFTGLQVAIWGDTLSKGWMEVVEAKLVVTSPDYRSRQEIAGSLEEGWIETSEDRIPGMYLDFPDIDFPDGIRILRAVANNKEARNLDKRLKTTNIDLHLSYKGISKGEGTLSHAFIPHDHPEG
ncbi:hypothetical protein [Paenibacillus sacheonensis]|uniref:Uncharacterized protein n=1 Tax=Paenibacillus sacheonensis TaxID=742054 RepID=A0A7X4YTV1_9BACL|nr:hypothetical protein [Paenibacillus sacheonensis]MBM7568630.1 hypothetical protein [Paenibacillus sacheonensis]NBC72477.1 hypothetical protein [Paenibacillus sacheonensis]